MEVASRIPGQVSGFVMNSPLLFDLIGRLSDDAHYEILDVLPATQGVLDLFSHLSCKLYLPGCSDALYSMNTQELDTVSNLDRALEKTLGFRANKGLKLDMLFLWDLPNYMDRRVLASLIDYLRPHMKDSVKLHIYIHTRQLMPMRPARYSATTEGKVCVSDIYEATCKSPGYFQEALQDLLYPFRVNRSILLATGMQEYILSL